MASGKNNQQTASELGVHRETVMFWRARLDAAERLTAAEIALVSDQELLAMIEKLLRTNYVLVLLWHLVSKSLKLLRSRVLNPWLQDDQSVIECQEIAAEAIKRDCRNISTRSVERFLKEADLKPHQSRYWLNANLWPQALQSKWRQCELYAQAIELHQQGIHLVSTDEKTGIQVGTADADSLDAANCCGATWIWVRASWNSMFNCQFGGSNRTSDCPQLDDPHRSWLWLIFSRLLLLTQQCLDLHYRSIEYSSIGILGAVGHSCGLNQDFKVNLVFLNQWQPGWNF